MAHKPGRIIPNSDYNLRDCYNLYRRNKKYKLKGIRWRIYKNILLDYFEAITTRILDHSEELKMPFGLGRLCVLKYKGTNTFLPNGMLDFRYTAVDYKATNELWKQRPELQERHVKIYNLNEHSDGYKYTFNWKKKNATCPNKRFYRIRMQRKHKIRLANLIKTNPAVDYYLRPIRKRRIKNAI